MTSTQTVDRPEVDGLTRRGLVKRGAFVAGATVWTAPVVQSLSLSSAFAQTTSACQPFGSSSADAFFLRIKDDVGNLTTLVPALGPLFPGGVFTLAHASANADPMHPDVSSDGTLLPLTLPLSTLGTLAAAIVPVTAHATVGSTAAVADGDVAIESLDATLLPTLLTALPGGPGLHISATSIHTHATARATQVGADETGTLADIAALRVNNVDVDVHATVAVQINQYVSVRVGELTKTSSVFGSSNVADALARIATITVAVPEQKNLAGLVTTPAIGITVTIAQSTAHASFAQHC